MCGGDRKGGWCAEGASCWIACRPKGTSLVCRMLFNHMSAAQPCLPAEDEARWFFQQLAVGLAYFHQLVSLALAAGLAKPVSGRSVKGGCIGWRRLAAGPGHLLLQMLWLAGCFGPTQCPFRFFIFPAVTARTTVSCT